MIGILGGMGTQAGLDFCNKLAILNRGKSDQKYPLFILYNKSNIPKRPENLKKYYNVLKSLIAGCNLLKKNKFFNTKRIFASKPVKKIQRLEFFALKQLWRQVFIIDILIKILN